MEKTIQIILYILTFAIALYALSSLNYEKMIKGNHVSQAQVLYLLLAMALAYLSSQFLLGLM
ncbi:MAG: DUF1146 family protein [Erysipelotrichaceae bacterium]